MQGNENKNTNKNEKSKQTYRLSCLIRLLFHFIQYCLVTIKIADMWFISLLTLWFGLVISLL
jgi:hypothetical protein